LFFSSCRQESQPPSPDNPEVFATCVTKGSSRVFEIVTFNVEGFPKSSHISVTALASLIKAMDPDVVALQEVASEAGFNRLVKLLDGWTGYLNPVNNDEWNLAYLFKESETNVIAASGKLLFTDDTWAFPRSPFEIRIRHTPSAREVVLINLHLKCCSGSDNENSRKSASQKIKKYLDETMPNEAVVVLGDFNDEISSQATGENPFLNFVNDPSGYRFADMQIAKGSPLWWSYPSYPSHIDHILVTNELFPYVDTTMVIKASPCYPAYEEVISDHRPVVLRIDYEKK
jgi:endonuclease/exonuclease/phosphatase family metal-dependent hydrolase